jgi:hypothetical protein
MQHTKSQKKSHPVHPNTASAVVTRKVPKKTPIPLATASPLPVGTLPVVQIPSAPTGDPTVTTPAAPLPVVALPIPTSSGTTPATAAASASGTSTILDALPAVDAPAPPKGFVLPSAPIGLRGHSPSELELMALPGLLKDLGSFTDYGSVLGASATSASTIQSSVSTALGWRQSRLAAEAWRGYVKTEDAIAWKATMTLLDELKSQFLFAVSKNPALALTYPALAVYATAAKAISAKATVTRKKNALTKAAAVVAASTAAAVAAVKAEVVTPPAKGVTVNA